MQAIMISIRPKWCELMASGKKTIEVRKTRPKIETPFKCYIYCTKGRDTLWRRTDGCYVSDYWENENDIGCVGKVIGGFVCDKIDRMAYCGASNNDIQLKLVDVGLRAVHISGEYLSQCQLSYTDMTKYANGRNIYGWHISDLVIYDRPKPLSGFRTPCPGTGDLDDRRCQNCSHFRFDNDPVNGYTRWCGVGRHRVLSRPPQSWCYVEEIGQ